MWCKTLLVFLFLLPMILRGQPYYSISCDSQDPTEQFVIDAVYSGNTPFLRSYHYDSGVPIDLTSWSMSFLYSYGQFDTNGMVEIPGVVSATNLVTYTGGTNIFFQAYDRYYFSIRGISTEGYVKTFATGKMIQRYDPATETNLPTLMGQLNVDWWSNNVGLAVSSNTANIAIITTSKVSRVAFNGTNLIFEGRIGSNEAFNVAQALTNAAIDVRLSAEEAATTNQVATNLGFQAVNDAQANTNALKADKTTVNATSAVFEVRIGSNETFRSTTQPATNAALLVHIEEKADSGTNRFDELFVANSSCLDSNISGLTQGTYTGSVTTVVYTGVTAIVRGPTYFWGFTKDGPYGTATLSIAGRSLSLTNTGSTTNYFAGKTVDSNLLITISGDGTSKSDVSDIFVRQSTNGDMAVAGVLRVGDNIVINGEEPVLFDAPSDANTYGRKSNTWISVSELTEPLWVAASNSVVYTNDVVYLAALTNGTITESTQTIVSVTGRILDITVRTNYQAVGDYLTNEPLFIAVSNDIVYTNTATYTSAVANASDWTNNPLSRSNAVNLTNNVKWDQAYTDGSAYTSSASAGITSGDTNDWTLALDYTNYAFLAWGWGDWATNYLNWDMMTNTPDTLTGYGITDAYTKVESDAAYATTGTVGDISADVNTLDTDFSSHTNNESADIQHLTGAEKLLATNSLQIGGTNWLSIMRSMTNFVDDVGSSSNYLIYDTATRLLSGCVTNTGGGSSGSGFPLTNDVNLDGFTMSNGTFNGSFVATQQVEWVETVFTPRTDLVVTGAINPDVTGTYTNDGGTQWWNSAHGYNIEFSFDTWTLWTNTQIVGFPSWKLVNTNGSNPTGNYWVNANATGTATVAYFYVTNTTYVTWGAGYSTSDACWQIDRSGVAVMKSYGGASPSNWFAKSYGDGGGWTNVTADSNQVPQPTNTWTVGYVIASSDNGTTTYAVAAGVGTIVGLIGQTGAVFSVTTNAGVLDLTVPVGAAGTMTNQIMDVNGVLYTITNAPTAGYVVKFNPANSTAWFAAESGGGRGLPTYTYSDSPTQYVTTDESWLANKGTGDQQIFIPTNMSIGESFFISGQTTNGWRIYPTVVDGVNFVAVEDVSSTNYISVTNLYASSIFVVVTNGIVAVNHFGTYVAYAPPAPFFVTNSAGIPTVDTTGMIYWNGAFNAWPPVTNVIVEDGSYALGGRAGGSGVTRSPSIMVTNLGLTGLSGKTVTNIAVKIRLDDDGSAGGILTNFVQLVVNGVAVGNIVSNGGLIEASYADYRVSGPLVSTWGTNVTVSDMQSTGFGFKYVLQGITDSGNFSEIYLDQLQVEIRGD